MASFVHKNIVPKQVYKLLKGNESFLFYVHWLNVHRKGNFIPKKLANITGHCIGKGGKNETINSNF